MLKVLLYEGKRQAQVHVNVVVDALLQAHGGEGCDTLTGMKKPRGVTSESAQCSWGEGGSLGTLDFHSKRGHPINL